MTRFATVVVVAVVVLDAVVVGVLSVLLLPVHLGSVAVPVGALVAAVGNLLAVRALAPLTTRTLVVGLPLLAWVLVVLGLASSGPGGDTLLVADWRALLLLAAGLVPAALALGRHLASSAVAAGVAARERAGGPVRPGPGAGAQSAR